MKTIKPDQFGKDHWNLLAYIETCCVDKGCDGRNPVATNLTGTNMGQVNYERMRVNENRHPAHKVGYRLMCGWKSEYGTRLRGYLGGKALMMPGHDDIDCLNDLEKAGLVEWMSEATGLVQLTELGLDTTAKLRKFKANGGQLADFGSHLEQRHASVPARMDN